MKDDLITIREYCFHYKTELSFIEALEELGLIRLWEENDEKYIEIDQLPELEKYNRMLYDLEINPAGIDAIHHLLEKIQTLQEEISVLRNRLRFYE
ncbi:MAG: chaperone modulator CbpM [Flavobacteriaceae bacterium]|jgi:hypothetical protein|nr:chaperone modulator CbpM [Flavobacteriaceae bacterium]